MMMKKINSRKIALFSDIHWGKGSDNLIKLQNTQMFMKSFIKDLYRRKIKDVFFLGDFFENRTSVNIQTLNIAYNNLKKLCEYFNVYMILGNHDLFLKNSRKIQSVKPFKEIENLTIISDPTEIDFNGRSTMLCPWDTQLTELTNYDYMFGHFAMSGAELCGSVYNKGKYTMKDLTDIASLVFSGHFHIRKEYLTKNGKVITVGNPLQMDWGDYGNNKGFYILDTQTTEYEFIENVEAPKYIKLLWSEIKDGVSDVENITNNYIKIVVDCEYQYQDVLKMAEVIKDNKPLSCNIEYVFSANKHLLKDVEVSQKDISIDKIGYIEKFVRKIADESEQTIDIESVIGKIKEYNKLVG